MRCVDLLANSSRRPRCLWLTSCNSSRISTSFFDEFSTALSLENWYSQSPKISVISLNDSMVANLTVIPSLTNSSAIPRRSEVFPIPGNPVRMTFFFDFNWPINSALPCRLDWFGGFPRSSPMDFFG